MKEAKKIYLIDKGNYIQLRDNYAKSTLEDKDLLQKRKREKSKLRWRVLNKYFGKPKLKSINTVEYKESDCMLRVLSQFIVEKAIINENLK